MFFEVDKNKYIFIQNISAVSLEEDDGKFYWLFYTNYPQPIKSMYFQTKEDAIIWFRNLKYNFYRKTNSEE